MVIPFLFFVHSRSANIDSGSIKSGLDVRRVEFLNHLDAGTTIFRNLIDVGAFHQSHTNIGVPQAVRRTRIAVAVAFQAGPVKHAIKQLYVVSWENMVFGLWVFGGRR